MKIILTEHFFQLFASGLSQRGDTDEDGISGFLPADVLKELKRGLRLVSIGITYGVIDTFTVTQYSIQQVFPSIRNETYTLL